MFFTKSNKLDKVTGLSSVSFTFKEVWVSNPKSQEPLRVLPIKKIQSSTDLKPMKLLGVLIDSDNEILKDGKLVYSKNDFVVISPSKYQYNGTNLWIIKSKSTSKGNINFSSVLFEKEKSKS